MKQPLLGLVSLCLVVVISILVISIFDGHTLGHTIAVLFMAAIPTQIVLTLVFHAEYPGWAARLNQPLKGLTFVGITIVVSAIVSAAVIFGVGQGNPVTPNLVMFCILSVITTFWLSVLWRAWPLSEISGNPAVLVPLILIVVYAATIATYQFLDFGFLQGSPEYIAALDPGGPFPAWDVIVRGVTSVSIILTFVVLFEGWPIQNISRPFVRVILTTILVGILSFVVVWLVVRFVESDQIVYMVAGPVCVIFGVLIVGALCKGSLFAGMKQPIRGMILCLVVAAAAVAMRLLFLSVAPIVTGDMTSGPPTYAQELWLATALLAITFPILVAFSDYFEFWPLGQANDEHTGGD